MNITRITFPLVQITPIVLVVYVYHSDETLSLDMQKKLWPINTFGENYNGLKTGKKKTTFFLNENNISYTFKEKICLILL